MQREEEAESKSSVQHGIHFSLQGFQSFVVGDVSGKMRSIKNAQINLPSNHQAVFEQ